VSGAGRVRGKRQLAPLRCISQSGGVYGTATGWGMGKGRSRLRAALMVGLLALAGPALAGVTVLGAARIHSMAADQPPATALAWEDGRILALGTMEELQARYPGARMVDLGNATVVPGLIDAHGHVAGLGFEQMQARLAGADS